ncbi:hypothetical protein TRFO_08722 [Tritrichomonas foetus]|uniref:Uncharacterized protein n=1 Tax=Tritrichomonas foetus TaxID=1144522 RepID=A0A1J4JHY4_9EUKA|nr:hypothetical protein TRFO_08722 [Tritrichomonas foetus]|eukprot:OHS98726.1 hypothetical protein TRFO_08722 [Tritrichomonas foetus]
MQVDILDSDTKIRCINWFTRQINSDYGTMVEEFLNSFPFPNNEKHSLASFLKTIENNQYLSLSEMAEHFRAEIDFISSILGTSSDTILFIRGYFQTLLEKMKHELMPPEKDYLTVLDEMDNYFLKFRELVPNSRDDFIEMQHDNFDIVMLQMEKMCRFDLDIISYDDATNLKKIIDQSFDEKNIKDTIDLIQLYEPNISKKQIGGNTNDRYQTDESENENIGKSDDVFSFDLAKMTKGTFSKLHKYIKDNVDVDFKIDSDILSDITTLYSDSDD